ncbi:MAG: hypothetical protein HC821_05910 [Lewinella sp.]|nr:hypothetical protein [Lewinella sp.]
MGGLAGMVLITLLLFGPSTMQLPLGPLGNWSVSLSLLLVVIILLAGAVGSARLLLEAHTAAEVYGGYLVGFSSQLIALRYYF